jgi:hypothetical protein
MQELVPFSNVLINATLAADPRHEQARPVLAQRLRPEVELFISVQNLAGPKNKPLDSPKLARDKIQSLTRLRRLTVLPPTVGTIPLALNLCVEGGVTRQDYFGCQLAAQMIQESIPTISPALPRSHLSTLSIE